MHASCTALENEETGEAIEADRSFSLDGAKVSFKWNLRSPFKDGYGLALYVEPEYGTLDKITGQRRTELRAIASNAETHVEATPEAKRIFSRLRELFGLADA